MLFELLASSIFIIIVIKIKSNINSKIKVNEIQEVVDYENTLEQTKPNYLVSLYNLSDFTGDKIELQAGTFNKEDIKLNINSIKFIHPNIHLVFYEKDSPIFTYSTDKQNTLEYIKTGKWTSIKIF